MLTLEGILKLSFEEESKGNYKKGVLILEEAMKVRSELYIDILYELAMLYFRNGEYFVALIKLIEVYRLFKNDKVLVFIFEAYVYPNQEQYNKNYNSNKILLDEYPFFISNTFFPDSFENIELKLVWSDEKYMIYYIDEKFICHQCKVYCLEEDYNNYNLMLVHAFCLDNILRIEETNRRIGIYIAEDLQSRNPMYLYYEAFEFIAFLFSNNIESVLKKERIVFLIERKSLDCYFENLSTDLPDYILNFEKNDITMKMKEVVEKRKQRINCIHTEGKNKLVEYYYQNEKLIVERIKSGKPRMLFITSRYTTALQYHAKNLYHAAVKMGLDAHLIIEKTSIHVSKWGEMLCEVEEFKPDIIVLLDHFRFELPENLPKVIIFLTWIQDPMSIIMDKATPKKLIETDFILNHYISWNEFFDIGYDSNKLIDAPVPGNQDIYKSYELSEEERLKYSCDICMLSHDSVIADFIEKEMGLYNESMSKEIIKKMHITYYKQALEKEKICYSKQQFIEYIKRFLAEEFEIVLEEEVIDSMAQRMYLKFGSKVYRQVLMEWILSAGFKNVKLWGRGWDEEMKFTPYAMGSAKNGEELSKILQASKIVIGNNYACTATARVWETMLSGGFYLSNYVPEEYDAIDLRKILEQDDYVMFKSKSELLEKIDYFLSHEEERVRMAKIGREKALEKMTFDTLLDRILNQLKEKL